MRQFVKPKTANPAHTSPAFRAQLRRRSPQLAEIQAKKTKKTKKIKELKETPPAFKSGAYIIRFFRESFFYNWVGYTGSF
jgi:hypothetical protein